MFILRRSLCNRRSLDCLQKIAGPDKSLISPQTVQGCHSEGCCSLDDLFICMEPTHPYVIASCSRPFYIHSHRPISFPKVFPVASLVERLLCCDSAVCGCRCPCLASFVCCCFIAHVLPEGAHTLSQAQGCSHLWGHESPLSCGVRRQLQ